MLAANALKRTCMCSSSDLLSIILSLSLPLFFFLFVIFLSHSSSSSPALTAPPQIGFAQICEYTSTANVSRSRSNFYHARVRFLLYTQRHHYHFRLRLRGTKHVVFYSPPDFADYYSDVLNTIAADTDASCHVIFSRHDLPALERIAGTDRAQRLVGSDKAVHMFV